MSTKTAEQRIAEAMARRQQKNDEEKAARAEQHANDLEAIEALEAELGHKINPSKQVQQFKAGLPVIVGVRSPSAAEYKRMFAKVNSAGQNANAKVAAHTELARSCWVYPKDEAQREAMIEANSGLLASIGNFANKLAEVELAEEGKE